MPEPKSFTGNQARLMLRRSRTGTLATLNREGGTPYGSLINVATDVDGRPIILISRLAWHTRNLLADGRASLLVAEPPEEGDALTGARVTVMGQFAICNEARLRRRYLARHPEAHMYVDFGDFGFWRLEPEIIHAVAGFGRIETLAAIEVFPPATEITALEDSAIAHLNEDHAEAVKLLAANLPGVSAGDWKVTAVDPDGVDFCFEGRSRRLEFALPVFTGSELRRSLAELSAKTWARQ